MLEPTLTDVMNSLTQINNTLHNVRPVIKENTARVVAACQNNNIIATASNSKLHAIIYGM